MTTHTATLAKQHLEDIAKAVKEGRVVLDLQSQTLMLEVLTFQARAMLDDQKSINEPGNMTLLWLAHVEQCTYMLEEACAELKIDIEHHLRLQHEVSRAYRGF